MFRVYKMTGQARDEGVSIEKFYIEGVLRKIECWKLAVYLQGRSGGGVAGD